MPYGLDKSFLSIDLSATPGQMPLGKLQSRPASARSGRDDIPFQLPPLEPARLARAEARRSSEPPRARDLPDQSDRRTDRPERAETRSRNEAGASRETAAREEAPRRNDPPGLDRAAQVRQPDRPGRPQESETEPETRSCVAAGAEAAESSEDVVQDAPALPGVVENGLATVTADGMPVAADAEALELLPEGDPDSAPGPEGASAPPAEAAGHGLAGSPEMPFAHSTAAGPVPTSPEHAGPALEVGPSHATGLDRAVEVHAAEDRALPAGLAKAAAAAAAETAEPEGGKPDTAIKPPSLPEFKAELSPPATSPQGQVPGQIQPLGARPGAEAAAAQPGPQAQPSAPQVPLGTVPVEIGLKALAGINRFEIRLDPAELGRIDVRLDISDTGEVKAHLTVDRVETLALLQRDAKSLERAFEQAGLSPSEGGVDLSLRDRSPEGRQDQRSERPDEEAQPPRQPAADRAENLAAPPLRHLWRGAAGVDMRI